MQISGKTFRIDDEYSESSHFWIDTSITVADRERQGQRRTATIIIIFCLLLVGLFIQVVNWDQYSLEIIPLKLSEAIGTADAHSFRRISDICEARKKYSCAVDALTELSKLYPDVGDLLDLADLLRRTGSELEAIAVYEKALPLLHRFRPPRADDLSRAHYGLAKCYEKTAKIDQAAKQYKLALESKPEVIQITVAEDYIHLLQGAGRVDVAIQVANDVKRHGGSLNVRLPASRN